MSFKPGTDDIRNTPTTPFIEGLQERGAEVVAYDPIVDENIREVYPTIEYAESAAETLHDTATALDEFGTMATPVVIDSRHAIDRRDGIVYKGLTW